MTMLDVLLVEASAGDGAADAERLEAAGHRVHRCFDGDSIAVHPSGWKPCVALTAGSCPLDGGIDVALLVRRGIAPRPGPNEVGLRCVIRAGVPIVEDGGPVLDPFDPWVDRRTDGDGVVQACEAAATESMMPAVHRLRELSGSLLAEVGVDPEDVTVRFARDGDDVRAVIVGPPLPARVSRALCTRMVDAMRAMPRSHSRLGVTYEATGTSTAP